jgi:hypothetical protein
MIFAAWTRRRSKVRCGTSTSYGFSDPSDYTDGSKHASCPQAATETMVAYILLAKCAGRLPLYRQAQMPKGLDIKHASCGVLGGLRGQRPGRGQLAKNR